MLLLDHKEQPDCKELGKFDGKQGEWVVFADVLQIQPQ